MPGPDYIVTRPRELAKPEKPLKKEKRCSSVFRMHPDTEIIFFECRKPKKHKGLHSIRGENYTLAWKDSPRLQAYK